MTRFRSLLMPLLVLVLVGWSITGAAAQTADPQADLRALSAHAAESLRLAQQHDLPGATAALAAFRTGWPAIEDGIRDRSRSTYRDIEQLMGDARYALEQGQEANAIIALEQLVAVCTAFSTGPATSEPVAAPGDVSLVTFQTQLTAVHTAIQAQDGPAALTALEAAQTMWPDVEGAVKIGSADAYTRIEAAMPEAAARLRAGDLAGAAPVVAAISADVQPFLTVSRYGVFDAMTILLREGLEALLVIAALVAFLARSGNGDKRRWIWLGGAAGVLASLVTAFAINLAFKELMTGSNRELLEGITGLVAAAMLFSVSYWLHSKAQLGAWQRYIQTKTTAALATGSLFSLAMLAFLAVYREGAETTLFLIGIAPAISTRDLILGVGAATVILILCGVAVLWLGVRLPLRPFFQVTSLLIFYLGFKFIGTGVHGLQVAQVVPATPSSLLVSSAFFGMFPTWETTVPQVLVLIVAGGAFWVIRRTAQRARATQIAPVA